MQRAVQFGETTMAARRVTYITIDRLELKRLREEQNKSQRAFNVPGQISKRRYITIETTGLGTEKKLLAIAKVLGLPKGFAEFLPVRISGMKARERRRCLGLTEEEVAERCRPRSPPRQDSGIDPETITAETIRQIEAGEAPNGEAAAGSHDLSRRLAAALECLIEDLVDNPSSSKTRQAVVAELLGPLSERWVRGLFESQDKKTGGLRSGFRADGSFTQPWSTAQALVGAIQAPGTAERYQDAIRRAFTYLGRWRLPLGRRPEALPPKQEQGWALFEGERDTPVTEITCWVLVAHAHALQAGTIWPQANRGRVVAYLADEVPPLLCRQYAAQKGYPAGGFCPTVELYARNQRTYSTAMALWALLEIVSAIGDELPQGTAHDALSAIDRGATWLLRTRHAEYGWVPNPLARHRYRAQHPGLTAQVLFVLTLLRYSLLGRRSPVGYLPALEDFLADAARLIPSWGFLDQYADLGINLGQVTLEGTPYRLEPSNFWWAPWSMALLGLLTRLGSPVGRWEQDRLLDLRDQVAVKTHTAMIDPNFGFWCSHLGEILFGVSWLGDRTALPAVSAACCVGTR